MNNAICKKEWLTVRRLAIPFCLEFERNVMTPEQELERLRRELAEAKRKVVSVVCEGV